MLGSYPGSELGVEQLVHALYRAVESNAPVRRELFECEVEKLTGIEQKLSHLLQEIRTIKNTHAPISKLPPEVLSRVLEHRAYETDLVAATHVCRYWRFALTSNPTLWARIEVGPGYNVRRTLAYLERSKSTVIDIRITLTPAPEAAALGHLIPHIPRARSFLIQSVHCDEAYLVSSLLLCNPVPSLEHLVMRANRGPCVRYLDNFLDNHAPSLRSAIFVGIFPALNFDLTLPGLTELTLHLSTNSDRIGLRLFLQFCDNCPRLQKMHLRFACEMAHDVESGQITLMESLEEFDFTSTVACRLLPYMDLPSLKRLQISSRLQAGRVDGQADFLPHNAPVLLAGSTIMVYRADHVEEAVELSGNGILVSIIATFHGSTTIIPWLSNGKSIPFEQIQYLKIEGSSTYPDFPINLLRNVTTIQLAPRDRRLVDFLVAWRPQPGGETPLPSLRRVDCKFAGLPGLYVKLLTSLAMERKRVGHPIQLVRMVISVALDRDVRELKKHVGELQVRVGMS